MKTSFICTVFNEEKTVKNFLHSIVNQSKNPDEVIIVDGGSTDATLLEISKLKSQFANKKIKFKILKKSGNRSTGRNEAIKNASNEVMLCSDAGNILDKKWVENISKPFIDKKVDIVAGYYEGKFKNIFQKSLIPYVLVMPDRVDPDNFLPATRSVAFKRSAWKAVGGFDEKLSHNEDYVFARSLKDSKFKIVFEKKAIVYWIPRDDVKDTFVMFARFAYGDIEAGIIRPKVVLIFLRYLVGLIILGYYISFSSGFLTILILLLVLSYFLWAVIKNYRYVKDLRAFIFLPLFQVVSDLAVIEGSILALII